jgi:2,3-bisphosphoglycerate-independent phosphoglycerate mutase
MDKIIFIVLDGIADRPVNGKTPLSSASTPNLDVLAERGILGIVDVFKPGMRMGSDTSHLALLGYNPLKIYTGRGPFEAAGAGIEVKPGDIAFRCNFATLKNGIVVDRRAGRIKDGEILAEAISREIPEIEGVKILFKAGVGHRAALVLRGEGLSYQVMDSDPKREGHPIKDIKALDPKAEKTARVLNEFMKRAHEILSSHPLNEERRRVGEPEANVILIRGGGVAPKLKRFEEKTKMRGCVIAAATLVLGIGRFLGMDILHVKGATGGVDSNVKGKIEKAVESLEDYDFVFVNIKGGDEAGHDGNFEMKKKFVERVDEALEALLGVDAFIVITSDHTTPVNVKDHTGDPVPLLICGDGVRRDEVKRFTELEAAKGGLCRIRGRDIIPILMDLTGRSEKFGA